LNAFAGAASATAMALQPDGKVVVVGGVPVNGKFDFALARYNADGSLDTTFGANNSGAVTTDFSGGADIAQAVVLQSDGKILVGRSAPRNDGTRDFALARYTSTGALDTAFGLNNSGKVTTDFSGKNDEVGALLLLSGGKVLAGGAAVNASGFDFALA